MVPVEPVSVSLAVIATADLCLKYFRDLVQLCEDYKDAEKSLVDFMVAIRAHRVRLEEQIATIRRLVDTINEEQQQLFVDIFQRIIEGLQRVTSKWSRISSQISSSNPVKARAARLSYAAYFKTSLDLLLKSINRWHMDFDPLYYLLTSSSHESVTRELDERSSGNAAASVSKFLKEVAQEGKDNTRDHTSIFKDSNYVNENESKKAIPFSTSRLCPRSETKDHIILDTVGVPKDVAEDRVLIPVRDLARKLNRLGLDNARLRLDETGLRPCNGVIKRQDDHKAIANIDYIFAIPKGFKKPRTLRQALMDSDQSFPLDQRFQLARQLSRAIIYLHVAKFVHKNVRPETILVFDKISRSSEQGEKQVTAHAALVGFERLRPDDTASYTELRDDLWYKDIYRHPMRQGINPANQPLMQHDIYSLGVCLLEIGLWTSFVQWNALEGCQSIGPAFQFRNKLKDRELEDVDWRLNKLFPQNTLQALNEGTDLPLWRKRVSTSAEDMKAFFVALATDILPGRMAQKYSEIVRSCLVCLDAGITDFGEERDLRDDDGIVIGTRYMEKILFRLQEIVL